MKGINKKSTINDTNLYLDTLFKNPIVIVQEKKKYCFEAMDLVKIYKGFVEYKAFFDSMRI